MIELEVVDVNGRKSHCVRGGIWRTGNKSARARASCDEGTYVVYERRNIIVQDDPVTDSLGGALVENPLCPSPPPCECTLLPK